MLLPPAMGTGSLLTLGGNYVYGIFEGGGSRVIGKTDFFFFWEKNHLLLHYTVTVIYNDYCVFSKLRYSSFMTVTEK